MAVDSETGLIILGVLGLFGNTLAVIIGASLTARNTRRAQEHAAMASLSAVRASQDLEIAKRDAAESTRALLAEARRANEGLITVGHAVDNSYVLSQDTNDITHDTHRIINGQNTKLLHAIALLTERLAKEHPRDNAMQEGAVNARRDYEAAVDAKRR